MYHIVLYIGIGKSNYLYWDMTFQPYRPALICTVSLLRPIMGACLLRASEGACVRRFEARLLLPDASLLSERGGTKPGESFNISTHAQPCVSPHEFKNSDDLQRFCCWQKAATKWHLILFPDKLLTQNCKCLACKQTHQHSSVNSGYKHEIFCTAYNCYAYSNYMV